MLPFLDSADQESPLSMEEFRVQSGTLPVGGKVKQVDAVGSNGKVRVIIRLIDEIEDSIRNANVIQDQEELACLREDPVQICLIGQTLAPRGQ